MSGCDLKLKLPQWHVNYSEKSQVQLSTSIRDNLIRHES